MSERPQDRRRGAKTSRQLEKYARLAINSHSPSIVAMNIGQDFGTGLAIGLDQSTPKVTKSAENLAKAALTAAKSQLSSMQSNAQSLASSIASAITGAGDLSNITLKKPTQGSIVWNPLPAAGQKATYTVTGGTPGTTAADIAKFEMNKAAQAEKLLHLAKELAKAGYSPAIVSQVEQMGLAGIPYAQTLLEATKAQVREIDRANATLQRAGNQAGRFGRQEVYGPALDKISQEVHHLNEEVQSIATKLAAAHKHTHDAQAAHAHRRGRAQAAH